MAPIAGLVAAHHRREYRSPALFEAAVSLASAWGVRCISGGAVRAAATTGNVFMAKVVPPLAT
jgi:hypothetical protein